MGVCVCVCVREREREREKEKERERVRQTVVQKTDTKEEYRYLIRKTELKARPGRGGVVIRHFFCTHTKKGKHTLKIF